MSSDIRETPSTEQADRSPRVDATERESRAVVEAAREKGWERPTSPGASTSAASSSTLSTPIPGPTLPMRPAVTSS